MTKRTPNKENLMSTYLVQYPFGRILLHVAVTMRRPRHWRWALAGIRRELT
jgi:hypothetical protein